MTHQNPRGTKRPVTAAQWVAVIVPVAVSIMSVLPMHAQLLHATGPRPSFEVASIRPSRPDDPAAIAGHSWRLGSYTVRGITIKKLISYAYGIWFDPEFSGGPKWVGTEKFDIEARPDDAAALNKLSSNDRDEQMRLMVQSLLADRFKLKVSFEKRQLPLYELVVAKGGLKCTKPAKEYPISALPPPRFPAPPPPPPPPASTPEEANNREQSPHVTPKGWPFWFLVSFLSNQPELGGRIVVDKTGLSGAYDCNLSWSKEGSDAPGPSFFTAIQEQMGLKLQPAKGPVEVLVVDHIEPPSEN